MIATPNTETLHTPYLGPLDPLGRVKPTPDMGVSKNEGPLSSPCSKDHSRSRSVLGPPAHELRSRFLDDQKHMDLR